MDLIGVVELVVHEASDDTGFADGLVPQNHQLVFRQSRYRSHLFRSDFQSISLLFYYHSEIFWISGFKIRDLVSYRLALPRWVELSFCIGNFKCVVLRVKWLCMVSSLRCEFAIATMLSLLRTFLFGFYNFIRGTPLLAIVILFRFSWMWGLINAWI